MTKRRFSALFLTLTLALLFCSLPAAAAEGDGWLVPKVREAPAFTDMAGVWCEDAVQTVCQTGLMQGRSDGSFGPSGELTGAHIVTICARLYGLLTGGDGVLPEPAEGQEWYDPAYASLSQALDRMGATGSTPTALHAQTLDLLEDIPPADPVHRQTFVSLLVETLQTADVTLPSINQITVVPDFRSPGVLSLYNAGILTGSDQYGSFGGGELLNRGQAAAILARLVDPAQRVTFTPAPFDLCADVLGLEADSQAISIEYDGIAAELSADIVAPALCEHLERQYNRMLVDGPNANDLDLVLRDTIASLEEDVAISRLAAQLGITVTDAELKGTFGAVIPGYLGMTAAAQQWENTCFLLYNKLQDAYEEEYGIEVVAPSPGAPSIGEETLYGDLMDMMEQMTALTAPEIQDLDAAQTRLVNSPAYGL